MCVFFCASLWCGGVQKKEEASEPTTPTVDRLTLQQMLGLGFYELLGCDAGAHSRTVRRCFNTLARIYHPDKGGSATAFRYLRMAAEVLQSPATRAEYDANGKGRWARVFAAAEDTRMPQEEDEEGSSGDS